MDNTEYLTEKWKFHLSSPGHSWNNKLNMGHLACLSVFPLFLYPWGCSSPISGTLTEDSHLNSSAFIPILLPQLFSAALPPLTWIYCLGLQMVGICSNCPYSGRGLGGGPCSPPVLLIGLDWLHAGLSKSRYLPTSLSLQLQTRLLREAIFTLEAIM